MLELFYEETEILDLDPEFFRSWLHELCQVDNLTLGDISLVFCSDDYLLDMNVKHLKHDYYTDIITFDYREGERISGDLFISIDRVKDNAAKNKVEFIVELYRVVAHGILHIMGYKDKAEQEILEMRRMEEAAINMVVSRET